MKPSKQTKSGQKNVTTKSQKMQFGLKVGVLVGAAVALLAYLIVSVSVVRTFT